MSTFLSTLGLERYLAAFTAADIDMETIGDLTDADLQSLGLSLGHRRKLLKAAAQLSSADPEPREQLGLGTGTEEVFERRQISVAFCDLVGSTAIAAQLDPEDAREVMQGYRQRCAAVVERYGGSITQVQGDGVIVCFGYPTAHEDDAERAVSCGLELVEAVAELTTTQGVGLQARVGIASGPVIVGSRPGATNEPGASGNAPNLAARLQVLAEPGQVVIDAMTNHLVEGVFTTGPMGAYTLKGFAEPVPAWLVQSIRANASRFAARHARPPAPLIGREHELGLLLHRWRQAESGDGQVVLLSAEAGYGKSRLVAALLEQLPATVYKPMWQCSPRRTNTALYPAIDNLARTAGITGADPASVRLAKLEQVVRDSRGLELFAELLAIPTASSSDQDSATPEQRKREIFDFLLARLRQVTGTGPVCFVVEDVHWIDPTTIEILDLAIDLSQALPVLIILTARPEFAFPWTRRAHATTLALNRMSRSESRRLAAVAAGEHHLPEPLQERIIERAEGVPLFIEELTRAMIEAGLAHGPESHASALIPSSLQSSLIARLDRLSAVKEVAQTAAVIGRDFSRDLLAVVSLYDPATLDRALEQLIEAGIIEHRTGAGPAHFTFKHALLQDAAHGSLVRARRRMLHLRTADAIVSQDPERASAEPDVLAHHLTEAGETERAITAWLEAAVQATDRSASRETLAHTDRALELLATLEATPERDRREAKIHALRIPAAVHAHGYSSDELEAIFKRLQALHHEGDDAASLARALYGEYLSCVTRANSQRAIEVAERWLAATQHLEDPNPHYHAMRARAYMRIVRGELAAAEDDLGFLKRIDWNSVGYQAGDYSGMTALANIAMYSGLVSWLRGYADQSRISVEEAAHHSAASGRPLFLAYFATISGTLLLFQDDDAALAAAAKQVLEFGDRLHIITYTLTGRGFEAVSVVRSGDYERGLAMLTATFAAMDALKHRFLRPHLTCWLAEALAGTNQTLAGLRVLEEAREAIAKSGEAIFAAPVAMKRGQLLLKHGDEPAARSAFREAFDLAAAQGARMLQLEAATALAGVLEAGEATAMLEPLYAAFSEGFDTGPLRRAREVLDRVRGLAPVS